MFENGHPPSQDPDFLTLQPMAELLAVRLRRPDEAIRPALDRLRKLLQRAAVRGDLTQMGPTGDPGSYFVVQEVLRWARLRFPDGFDDVPLKETVCVGESVGIRAGVRLREIPGDLGRCQNALQEAQDLIRYLEGELQVAQREIAELAPLAERQRERVESNRRSARLPRKGQ